MPWGQVFRFHLRAAAGTIKFDDPYPQGIGGEGVLAFHERRMDFARIALIEKAPAFVVFARRSEYVSAAIAGPPFIAEMQVQVLGDANAVLSFVSHQGISGTLMLLPTHITCHVSIAELIDMQIPTIGNKVSATWGF